MRLLREANNERPFDNADALAAGIMTDAENPPTTSL